MLFRNRYCTSSDFEPDSFHFLLLNSRFTLQNNVIILTQPHIICTILLYIYFIYKYIVSITLQRYNFSFKKSDVFSEKYEEKTVIYLSNYLPLPV